jgi:3-methyladenine DNA glycosylase AlkD
MLAALSRRRSATARSSPSFLWFRTMGTITRKRARKSNAIQHHDNSEQSAQALSDDSQAKGRIPVPPASIRSPLTSIHSLKAELGKAAVASRVKTLQTFFKTGAGEYGENDVFVGIRVPEIRLVVKMFRKDANVSVDLIVKDMLQSTIHEERTAALLLLIDKMSDALESDNLDDAGTLFYEYLDNCMWVNNWDLVDISARDVVGRYLYVKHVQPSGSAPAPESELYQPINSFLAALVRGEYQNRHPLLKTPPATTHSYIWPQRIAMISTLYFIKMDAYQPTLDLAVYFIGVGPTLHDLLQKATGWLLREVGKRNRQTLTSFLDTWAPTMPRVMLRYALEHYPAATRKKHLAKCTR